MEEDPQHQPQASTCVYMFTCARTHMFILHANACKAKDKKFECCWTLGQTDTTIIWLALSLSKSLLQVSFFFFSLLPLCFYFFSQSTTCCTSLPGLSCPATTTNLCQPSLSFMMPKRAQQPLPVLPPTCWSLMPRGVFFCRLFLPLLESRTLSLCFSWQLWAPASSSGPHHTLLMPNHKVNWALSHWGWPFLWPFGTCHWYLIFLEIQSWLSSLYPFCF